MGIARVDVLVGLGLALSSFVVVLPTLWGGAGFYLDDWRNLARLDTVGWLRSAEAGRFASRPGAWSVEMVLYPVLRDRPTAWLLVLVVLNAVAATVLYVAVHRFAPRWVAVATALVWVALPNHTSLKVFPNTAPMVVGLILLMVGIVLADLDRPVHAAVAVAAGGLCLEVMLLPGVAALWALHRWRGRGSRRQLVIASAVIVGTGCLMLIHPTYSVSGATRGSPAPVLPAHFGAGLTTVPALAWVLGALAAVGIVVATVQYARGRREEGGGPWLVVVGLAVMAVGLAAFVLKWPTGYRGQADRNYVVSSVGAAMVWVGVARVLFDRSRVALGASAGAFLVLLAATNVAFQADWVRSAEETRHLLRAVDCEFDGRPPEGLVVGPSVRSHGQVRAIHQFFLDDASRVVVGRTLDFTLAETEEEWIAAPAELRRSWDELLSAPTSCR